ncbi:alpha/beta fold hydrolase [Rhizobium sp. YIM 134829]|uniref:alpha/beta fold hydrolase n=1 Tax=Rhizobium sp. YIM 134829 TaxID=3390453 RepID=UPI0039788EA4
MRLFTAEDGCRIHVETFGKVGPRLLLIPGLGGDGRFFSGVIADLQADHRLVVMDHRGAGRSDRPETTYSIPQIARDAAAILSDTGGPAHVIGHSTGGAIVQDLLLDYAELCLSGTISSSWARADARFQTLFTVRADMLEAGQVESYQRLTHVLCHDGSTLEREALQMEAAVSRAAQALAPLSVATKRIRMLLDHDRLAQLPRIRQAVQVIAAEDDILTPPALTRAVAEAISGASFRLVPGAHFHPLTHPSAFAEAVRFFIAGLSHGC